MALGRIPFSKATHLVDRCERPGGPDYSVVDVNRERLPFADGAFDFVYARHVVEDLYNPFLLLSEMNRVGRAGYIETPSPVCELNHDVNGGAPNHRGYIHHKSIVWTDRLRHICLVEKATIVEHMLLDDRTDELEADPFLWNTYFFWDQKFTVNHYEHDLDFQLHVDYAHVLARAMRCAMMNAAQTRKLIGGIEL